MGLNQTLDRLKAEREAKEAHNVITEAEAEDKLAKALIANLADRIFF